MTLVSKSRQAIESIIFQLEVHFKLRRLGSTDFLLVEIGIRAQRRLLLKPRAKYLLSGLSPESNELQ